MSSSITVINNIEDIVVTVTDDTVIPTIVIETAQQGPQGSQGPIGPKPVLDVTSTNGTLTVTVDDEVTTTLDVVGFITSTLNVDTGIPGSDVQYTPIDNTITIPRGASAYEVAVAEGFVGTVDDWLDSLIATARDAADEFANAPRGVEVEPGKYSGRHYMEESEDILENVISIEDIVINAKEDADKIVNSEEYFEYTLSDGVTTGYSAKHYASKTNEDSTATSQLALQVSNDATQVASNKILAEAAMVQTGLDRVATANDVLSTSADKLATNADAVSTSADRVQTGLDRAATNSDVVQTGSDKTQTGLDRVQTGNDVVSAASSAAEALASEIAAATSAFDAALALSQVETIMDNFDDRYLGAHSIDPILDNDGNALTVGTIYYNTLTNELRFYDGTIWDRPEYSASQSAIASEASRVASVDAKVASESARDTAVLSAANASASEAASALSEINAEASATLADDRATFIDELVLGAKSSDPLVSNTGGALQIGSVYYNTVSYAFRVWVGTEWRTAVFDASNAVVTFNGRSGNVELTESDVNTAVGINVVAAISANTNLIIGNTSSILQLAKSNTHGAFGSPSLSINVGSAPQTLPFSVLMQSTNTDRFVINTDNTITAKASGTYVFNSTLNIEDVGANGAVRGLVFKITDGTNTWHTEVVNVEISGNDRDVIPVNSVIVLPEGSTLPATAYITVEYPSGTSGYRIVGFQSILATEKTVAELQGLASGVVVAPVGSISSTNVQDALLELDSEKVSKPSFAIGYHPALISIDSNKNITSTNWRVVNGNVLACSNNEGEISFDNSTINYKNDRIMLDGSNPYYIGFTKVGTDDGIEKAITNTIGEATEDFGYVLRAFDGTRIMSINGLGDITTISGKVNGVVVSNLSSANGISVEANGNLSSTNVQSALEELQSDIDGLDDYLGSLLTEELI